MTGKIFESNAFEAESVGLQTCLVDCRVVAPAFGVEAISHATTCRRQIQALRHSRYSRCICRLIQQFDSIGVIVGHHWVIGHLRVDIYARIDESNCVD